MASVGALQRRDTGRGLVVNMSRASATGNRVIVTDRARGLRANAGLVSSPELLGLLRLWCRQLELRQGSIVALPA